MKPLSRAGIIAVGSELLTPLRIDTNSLFITEQLNLLGIEVVVKAVGGDDRDELAHLFRAILARADVVIFSGGLGPTDDDVTREVVASVLNRPLREDERLTTMLRERFAARVFAMPMPESNRRQAMVPEGGRPIQNTRGSAPGLWIEHGDQLVVLLPGPPRELRPMLTALVDGDLRRRAAAVSLVRRIVKIAGRIESETDERLQPLYRKWSAAAVPVAATILAAPGHIELHLSARQPSREVAEQALAAAAADVVGVLGADAYSTDGRSLEQVVGHLLLERQMTIGVAESCTGGLITSRLTDVVGSSRYVDRSVVSYSNQAKTELLGVPPELIAEHGAVSDAVALAMADGIRSRAGVSVGVGVTGIAGPGGGTPEKPVGTVAIAAMTATLTRSRVFRFTGERETVKFQASHAALDMVRRLLLDSR